MAITLYFCILIANIKNFKMRKLVGRKHETKLLNELKFTGKSEFVAMYGRRRVGKTFLIRSTFNDRFTFHATAIANVKLATQLDSFYATLKKYDLDYEFAKANNWFDAFKDLAQLIERSKDERKIIFLDELPWFDTHGSKFIPALENFWNSWASFRDDVLLLVCGSAASWIINKLINHRGGLHNRLTKSIKLLPFTLSECEEFLLDKQIHFQRYDITQIYMSIGGIPFYWEFIKQEFSVMQNIEALCFSKDGQLTREFDNLYHSLFKNADKHMQIIEALATKSKGLTRDEIVNLSKLPNGGGLTRLLVELEESGFIRKYVPFQKKYRQSLYQGVDFFSNFYMKFMKDVDLENTNWQAMLDHPKYRAWSGYAFEQVCLSHVLEIKKALSIAGIVSANYSWRSQKLDTNVQIDLLIDRRDNVVTICEMKYSINAFEIDKAYSTALRNKIGVFQQETKTRKSVNLLLVTTFGLKQNMYSRGLAQNEVTMDDLFLG